MSAPNNGGPAFPVNVLDQISGQIYDQHAGMTLRDYFAAHAPIGVSDANDAFYCQNGRNARMSEMLTMLAELRGRYADAMLAERESGQLRFVPKEAYDQCNAELAKAETLLESIGYRYKGKGEWEAPAAKVQS